LDKARIRAIVNQRDKDQGPGIDQASHHTEHNGIYEEPNKLWVVDVNTHAIHYMTDTVASCQADTEDSIKYINAAQASWH